MRFLNDGEGFTGAFWAQRKFGTAKKEVPLKGTKKTPILGGTEVSLQFEFNEREDKGNLIRKVRR